MQSDIISYLNSQSVGVLALERVDGAPHGATLHYVYSPSLNALLFETHKDSRKAELLISKNTARASFVVGTDESTKITLQIDGSVHILTQEERIIFEQEYIRKFQKKAEKMKSDAIVCFKLVPHWWRFIDWSSSEGKKVLTS